jgi:hypothetical protein
MLRALAFTHLLMLIALTNITYACGMSGVCFLERRRRGERRKRKKYIKYTVGITIESIRNMKIP